MNQPSELDVPPATGSGRQPSLLADPRLRTATASDVHRLKAVLEDAFYDDPIFDC